MVSGDSDGGIITDWISTWSYARGLGLLQSCTRIGLTRRSGQVGSGRVYAVLVKITNC